jgi:hypothetical protein
MFGLPESFGGAGQVAPGKTGWQVRSSHALVQGASVETIAVAHRVHGCDFLPEAASGLPLVSHGMSRVLSS